MQNCRECVKYAKYTNGIKITMSTAKQSRLTARARKLPPVPIKAKRRLGVPSGTG